MTGHAINIEGLKPNLLESIKIKLSKINKLNLLKSVSGRKSS